MLGGAAQEPSKPPPYALHTIRTSAKQSVKTRFFIVAVIGEIIYFLLNYSILVFCWFYALRCFVDVLSYIGLGP